MAQLLVPGLLAAVAYDLLGVSCEVTLKRKYKIRDVIFYMQFTGLVIGLTVSGLLDLPFYNLHMLSKGLVGAVTFVGGLPVILRRRARARLPPTGPL